MTRYSKIRFADQLKRSSIAQFFNVNSTKIRLVIIGRREGHGRERGGTEWRKKGRKKQLVHISISTRVTIRERLRLRLVIVAVEGIPAIAGESFTGNAKEKCLSSLFLSLSVPFFPLPFPPPRTIMRSRLLFFKRASKSLQLADGLLPGKIYFYITGLDSSCATRWIFVRANDFSRK